MLGGRLSVMVILVIQCFCLNVCDSQEDLQKLVDIPVHENGNDICVAGGDPHINTFDGVRYEYHGLCHYTLVKNCAPELLDFEIIGEFERMKYHKKLSVIKTLLIRYLSLEIKLNSNFDVRINEEKMTSAYKNISPASIQRYSNAVVITMNNGITIYWGSPFRATIVIEPNVSKRLSGKLCGLCGINNAIKFDDFTTRDDHLESNVAVFADTWKTDTQCETCSDCDNTTCQINQQNHLIAQEQCSVVFDEYLPEDCGDKEALKEQCVSFLCATLPEIDGLCQLVNKYIEECVAKGVSVEVHLDGLCHEVDPCRPNPCNEGTCSEHLDGYACQCNHGWWGDNCQNSPPCRSNPCDNGGTCINEEGNYRCLCPFGVWGGPACTIKSYYCWACGDPHYRTFDGVRYDFQGKCMYTLVRSMVDFAHYFEVVANNVPAYQYSRVSITREVHVFLDFGDDGLWSSAFHWGYKGVLVNGVAVDLPYTNRDDDNFVRVEIRQSGFHTILTTHFGLYVVWNGVHCVLIVVPENFKDNVHGLCGLFNGDDSDDWTTPNDETVTGAIEFGNSWVNETLEACEYPCTPDTCTDNPCEDNQNKLDLAQEMCAYLNPANTGPFTACFDQVPPDPYFSNCKFDICAGLQMDSICDDMVSYVTDCRAQGVNIEGGWRDLVPSCSIDCGSMVYMECGPACPATCANPEAPDRCNEACVEGCYCPEELLWTNDGCVPRAQCGCTKDGVYYPPNTAFITPDCMDSCTCNAGGIIECDEYGLCGDNAKCTVRDGKRDCYCQPGFYSHDDQCVGWFTCWACGDPHYKTFDGTTYDFQGKCSYTLVKAVAGNVNFEVVAKNIEWNRNPRTSITRQLYIYVYNQIVWLRHDTTDVYVNDEVVHLPYTVDDDQMTMYRSGVYTVLVTDFGLQIIWNGVHCVSIRLPGSFKQKVLGLCGFFNGDPNDDFKDPDSNLITSGVNDFGNVWKFGNDECIPCTDENCLSPEDPCDDNSGGNDVCLPLSSDDSIFAKCFDTVEPEPFFRDCSYDACAAPEVPGYCEHFERYVSECRSRGVAIIGWRKIYKECAIQCEDTMMYSDCGNAFPKTCANPNRPNACSQTCVQGCQCMSGLLLSGNECVEPSQCGCQFNARYYMLMERFVTSDCTHQCLCEGNNEVKCDLFGCGRNAVCGVESGVRGCYCPDNYLMLADGRNCSLTSPCSSSPCVHGGQCIETDDMTSFTCNCPYGQYTGSTCSIRYYKCFACGDPHYRTFDGKYYDFQGKCKYTLVKSLNGTDEEFEVVANNIEYNTKVSITREIFVYISFLGDTWKFGFKYTSTSVFVNETAVNLPFYLFNEDGSVYLSIKKSGRNTVLWTDFGLIVEWNGVHCVKIYLPETYMNYAAGLCGFFTGDILDDFTAPNKTLLNKAIDFGNSWVYGECDLPCTPETCLGEPCKNNIVGTTKADAQCLPLNKITTLSPFGKCFDFVNPDVYFQNCKFDVCVDTVHNDTMCELFNLYVSACQEAGVTVGNWRTAIPSCVIHCDTNMEHQMCGKDCPPTCYQGAPAVCTSKCVEGCQCVAGLSWSSEGCIHADKCGCTFKRRYYRTGETVVSYDCSEECTCEAGGTMNCLERSTPCNVNEVCAVRNGKRGCYCPASFFSTDGICQPRFTCYACGDPHYKTFEGRRYNFMGRCSYILAQSRTDAPSSFKIVGDNIPWVRNPRATVTRFVFTYVYGMTVKFSYDTTDVFVNDKLVHLPYSLENRVIVYSSGIYKRIDTDFGLQVVWDGKWCIFIRVPAIFRNNVDGLCGHFSQEVADDFTTPEEIIVPNVNMFGNSWMIENDGDQECIACTDETCLTGSPCETDADAAAIADTVCSPLEDSNGPFADCFDAVERSHLRDDCRYDLCADPEYKEASCAYLQEYADECRKAGVNVNRWRDSVHQCGIECGEFMTYMDCGSACPATCTNLSAPQTCTRQCVQGCQCVQDRVLSGKICVPKEQCGCTDTTDGQYRMNEEQFISDDCGKRCTCQSREIVCENVHCDDNAYCTIQNGVRACLCLGKYKGDGFTCTSPCDQSGYPCLNGGECLDADNADSFVCRCREPWSGHRCDQAMLVCRASGDPHYVNFDGLKFDFQGRCEYNMVQNCDANGPEFTVIVDNEQASSNSPVSLTRTVTVVVYNQTVFMGQSKVVQINNGGASNLPVNNNHFDIYISGSYVILKTDFSLFVEWNGQNTVKVKVPNTFAGKLCGLCGNGNGIREDDMITPDGSRELDTNMFGHSWATNPDNCLLCEDCLTADACEVAYDDVVADAEENCRIISELPLSSDIYPSYSSSYAVGGSRHPVSSSDSANYDRRELPLSSDIYPSYSSSYAVGGSRHPVSSSDSANYDRRHDIERMHPVGKRSLSSTDVANIRKRSKVIANFVDTGTATVDNAPRAGLYEKLRRKRQLSTNDKAPFADCLHVVDPNEFYDDCMYDWCANGNRAQYCENVAAYAETCQLQGIRIGHWRRLVECEMECPRDAHYELCPSACQATCADPMVPASVCDQFCHEGCVCEANFILKNNRCIFNTDCGCVHDNSTYERETIIIRDMCKERCTCYGRQRQTNHRFQPDANGWHCEIFECGRNAVCSVVEGEGQQGFVKQNVCVPGSASGDLRLVDGSDANEGRVEVFHDGFWGTVCRDRWDIHEAKVVCRQLGHPYENVQAVVNTNRFGAGLGKIWLDEVSCTGSENNIDECDHLEWGSNNCRHSEDAGVICSEDDGYGNED